MLAQASTTGKPLGKTTKRPGAVSTRGWVALPKRNLMTARPALLGSQENRSGAACTGTLVARSPLRQRRRRFPRSGLTAVRITHAGLCCGVTRNRLGAATMSGEAAGLLPRQAIPKKPVLASRCEALCQRLQQARAHQSGVLTRCCIRTRLVRCIASR